MTGNLVQLQQVLAGLVMQAALPFPQSAPRADVHISVRRKGAHALRVSVGTTQDATDEESVESAPADDGVAPELGLDLTTCRVIVEAHGGRLWGASGARPGLRLGFDQPVAGTSPRPQDAATQ